MTLFSLYINLWDHENRVRKKFVSREFFEFFLKRLIYEKNVQHQKLKVTKKNKYDIREVHLGASALAFCCYYGDKK